MQFCGKGTKPKDVFLVVSNTWEGSQLIAGKRVNKKREREWDVRSGVELQEVGIRLGAWVGEAGNG